MRSKNICLPFADCFNIYTLLCPNTSMVNSSSCLFGHNRGVFAYHGNQSFPAEQKIHTGNDNCPVPVCAEHIQLMPGNTRKYNIPLAICRRTADNNCRIVFNGTFGYGGKRHKYR